MTNNVQDDFKERQVELFSSGRRRFAMIRWSGMRRESGDYQIALEGPEGSIQVAEGDLFEALIALRGVLASLGWDIAVQGGRHDSWATGMYRDMIGGERVYILEHGRPMRKQDLVHIFEPADPVSLGTPEEQRANYFSWRESVQPDL